MVMRLRGAWLPICLVAGCGHQAALVPPTSARPAVAFVAEGHSALDPDDRSRVTGHWIATGPSLQVVIDSGRVLSFLAATHLSLRAVIWKVATGGSEPDSASPGQDLGPAAAGQYLTVGRRTFTIPLPEKFSPVGRYLVLEYYDHKSEPPYWSVFLCAGPSGLDGSALPSRCP
jgi:hypothetical protein